MASERSMSETVIDLGFERREKANGLQRIVHAATGLTVGWHIGTTFWRDVYSQCCEVSSRRDFSTETGEAW